MGCTALQGTDLCYHDNQATGLTVGLLTGDGQQLEAVMFLERHIDTFYSFTIKVLCYFKGFYYEGRQYETVK